MQLKLTKKDIGGILMKYAIGRIGDIKPVRASGNLSYIIRAAEGEYFLRLCGSNNRWRSPGEIAGELELIEFLQSENFPVLNCEKMKSGKKIISVKGRNGYLRKFLRGKQINKNPSGEQLFKTGRILGRYHKLVKNYRANGLRNKIDFDVEMTNNYFEEEKNSILKSKFREKEKFIEILSNEINDIKLTKSLAKGMIHEDLGKRHVLWKNDEIAAIIDFDRSYYGYLILDLGQALRGWCFTDNWKKWSRVNYRKFLAGYETERRLSRKEKEYILPAIKFAILERALAFCSRYVYSKKPDVKDEKFALDCLFNQIKKVKI